MAPGVTVVTPQSLPGVRAMNNRLSQSCIAVLLAVAAVAAGAQPTQRYRVTDLGTLGGPESDATGINKDGLIVGYSNIRSALGPYRAIAVADGMMSELGGLSPRGESFALGVNDAGVACGQAEARDGSARAVVFVDGQVYDFASMRPDWLQSLATGINDAGHVVGNALSTLDFMIHGFVWTGTADTRPKMLPDPGSSANAINRHDQVVGAIFSAGMLFERGRKTPLGTLGGSWSEGVALNDVGEVTGWAALPGDGQAHAFVWRDGSMTDLGTLGGWQSRGAAIDRHGNVVGWSWRRVLDEQRAFIAHDGRMVDLNDLLDDDSGAGWLLHKANAIDEQGRIVGQGKHDGRFHAFLLTPMAR